MRAFHSGREAKEFLISRIVAEAQRENVPLSEVERKMLYFTESGWTLPDMTTVSEEFDREYDQNKYEKKIARLISKADGHTRKESHEEYDSWWAAIRFLRKEDHYILVMIRIAGLRPAGDQLKLFGTALAVVICFMLVLFLSIKYQIDPSKYLGTKYDRAFLFWITGVCVTAVYLLLRFVLGGKRTDRLNLQGTGGICPSLPTHTMRTQLSQTVTTLSQVPPSRNPAQVEASGVAPAEGKRLFRRTFSPITLIPLQCSCGQPPSKVVVALARNFRTSGSSGSQSGRSVECQPTHRAKISASPVRLHTRRAVRGRRCRRR